MIAVSARIEVAGAATLTEVQSAQRVARILVLMVRQTQRSRGANPNLMLVQTMEVSAAQTETPVRLKT